MREDEKREKALKYDLTCFKKGMTGLETATNFMYATNIENAGLESSEHKEKPRHGREAGNQARMQKTVRQFFKIIIKLKLFQNLFIFGA